MLCTWQTLFASSLLMGNIRAIILSFPPNDKSITGKLRTSGVLDDRYRPWVDSFNILYYMDENYSDEEKTLIHDAMSTIAMDMTQCVQFKEYNPAEDSGLDFIFISKTLNDGTTPPTCVTFYGRLAHGYGKGQKMVIHGERNGCMGSVREIMKVLVNALGLRNEYRRPDRERFMQVSESNLIPDFRGSNLLQIYNTSQLYYPEIPFDYSSITMLPDSKYGMPNAPIYSFPNNMSIPNQDHLSINDCIGLSWVYGCNVQACRDPYISIMPETTVAPVTSPPSRDINIGFLSLNPTLKSIARNETFLRLLNYTVETSQWKAKVLQNGTDDKFGQVNVTWMYPSGNANQSTENRSFVLNTNTTVADIQQLNGSVVLHLENVTNRTAVVGISGPPGSVASFFTASNSSMPLNSGNQTAKIINLSLNTTLISNGSLVNSTSAGHSPATDSRTLFP